MVIEKIVIDMTLIFRQGQLCKVGAKILLRRHCLHWGPTTCRFQHRSLFYGFGIAWADSNKETNGKENSPEIAETNTGCQRKS